MAPMLPTNVNYSDASSSSWSKSICNLKRGIMSLKDIWKLLPPYIWRPHTIQNIGFETKFGEPR